MSPREYQDKIIQAQSTGSPIFLTKSELAWLLRNLLETSKYYAQAAADGGPLGPLDKVDQAFANSIGFKCARELGQE